MARRALAEKLALFVVHFRKYPLTLSPCDLVHDAFGQPVSPVFVA
jgi:hypothetical protein